MIEARRNPEPGEVVEVLLYGQWRRAQVTFWRASAAGVRLDEAPAHMLDRDGVLRIDPENRTLWRRP